METKETRKSMRWFDFFSNYLVWVWLILGSLIAFSEMQQSIFENYNNSYQIYFSHNVFGYYNTMTALGNGYRSGCFAHSISLDCWQSTNK